MYCFYQLFTKYQERYNDGMIGLSPGLDSIMVVMVAWVLAPVDISLTWISWYKKAEEARRRQSSTTLLDEETFRNEEVHIY
jgi:uncharacterized membrane protein